jgi:hypothetical protein
MQLQQQQTLEQQAQEKTKGRAFDTKKKKNGGGEKITSERMYKEQFSCFTSTRIKEKKRCAKTKIQKNAFRKVFARDM